jgi:hypothetical protein
MALKLRIQTSAGIDVEYHRIISTNINWINKKITFTVASYLSEYTRRTERDPVETQDINVVLDLDVSSGSEQLITKLYEWVKRNAVGFENAIDC